MFAKTLLTSAALLIVAAQAHAETHTFTPKTYYTTFSHAHPPALRIKSGDRVVTKTIDARGFDWNGKSVAPGGNPQTGPFYIEGAEPVVPHILARCPQFAQTVDAITAEYLPAAQSSHSMLTPALDLNFPTGHMLQASLLRTALSLPASHTSHAPEVVTHPATPAALAASGSPISQTHGAP